MTYDLRKDFRLLNDLLLIIGEIDEEMHLDNEDFIDEYAELYVVNLN